MNFICRFYLNVRIMVLLACFSSTNLGAGAQTVETRSGLVSSGIQVEFKAFTTITEREQSRYNEEFVRAEGMRKSGAMPEAVARVEHEAWSRYCASVVQGADRLLMQINSHPDDPAAVEPLIQVAMTTRNFPTDQSRQSLMSLLRHHVCNEKISQMGWRIFPFYYVPEAEQLLRNALERNPSFEERGRACHDLAYYLQWQAEKARGLQQTPEKIEDYPEPWRRELIVKYLRKKDPEALIKESESLLDRCTSEFATVPGVGYFDGRKIGDVARGQLFQLRQLRIGKPAPEVQGTDAEGCSFKLSDYRGKVVILTFTGNWCGPCRGLYPQLRDLQQRWEAKPFAVVSVDTDEDRETLRKSIREGEITWRCWWDGGTDGPITTAWGVQSFPWIYVIDESGTIRFKDVRGGELDKAVASLLDKPSSAESGARPGIKQDTSKELDLGGEQKQGPSQR